jgi:LCP family protein required for cell wall assembly
MPSSVHTLAPEEQPVRQPTPPRRRRSFKQRAVLGTGILVVLAILAGVAVVGYAIWRFSQLRTEKLALAKAAATGPQNYLIVGSDSRSGISKNDPDYAVFNAGGAGEGVNHSDTIMVLRVDPSKRTAKLLSFPRDLWVPIYGTGGNQRINTAYSAGPQRLIDTIETDFGVPINHYVEVNFNSFRDVVNAVHGIPMYFATRVRDENSGLDIEHTGCQVLNGDQALSYARSRELQYYDTQRGEWRYDPTGDLGRITRQQIFVRKVIGRAESQVTGLNILATNNLVQSVIKNLKVDNHFSLSDMLGLLADFKLFDSNKLQTYSLPTTPFVTAGGADVLHLQQANAQPILDLFKTSGKAANVKPSQVTLSIENGGGVNGAAGRASTDLQRFGFTVSGTGNADATSATTIRYGSSAAASAALVARYVTTGAQLTEDSTLGSSQVVLVIGQDFGGITATAPGSSKGTSTSSTGSTTTTTAPIGMSIGQAPKGVSC